MSHLKFTQAAPTSAAPTETPAPPFFFRPIIACTPPLPVGARVGIGAAAFVVEVFEPLRIGDEQGFLQKSLEAFFLLKGVGVIGLGVTKRAVLCVSARSCFYNSNSKQ